MPKDLIELEALWNGADQKGSMDNNAKRMVLFAPEDKIWNEMAKEWNLVDHIPSQAGAGCPAAYDGVISWIAKSV